MSYYKKVYVIQWITICPRLFFNFKKINTDSSAKVGEKIYGGLI